MASYALTRTRARRNSGAKSAPFGHSMVPVSAFTRTRAKVARWFSLPNFYFLWPVPVVTALTAFLAWRWIETGREVPPFLATIALFLLGFLGLVISNFPYLVPPSLTIWDTAAAPASQIFMLLGTLLLLPIVLGYIGFIYWLFRGKVREGESYH
jgi:cytochrome d ubiquinol oxidase subunit II